MKVCACENCSHRVCAQRIPVFSGLDSDELFMVTSLIIRKRYSKGDFICHEGMPVDSLIIINQGSIKVFRDTPDGKEQILYILSEGDFFGEKNLLSDRAAGYSIEALEETGICSIHKDQFQKLLNDIPGIGLKVMEELIRRLDRLESLIESMGAGSVEARVGAVLLEFAGRSGKEHPKGVLVELPLSREGIANYIGLTRETVSRKLARLQDEGIIEMEGNKKIIITNMNALKKSVE